MHWSNLFFYNSGLDVTHNRVTIIITHYVSLEDGVNHKLNPTQNLPLTSTCIKAVLPGGSGSSISEMSEGSIPSTTSRGRSDSLRDKGQQYRAVEETQLSRLQKCFGCAPEIFSTRQLVAISQFFAKDLADAAFELCWLPSYVTRLRGSRQIPE